MQTNVRKLEIGEQTFDYNGEGHAHCRSTEGGKMVAIRGTAFHSSTQIKLLDVDRFSEGELRQDSLRVLAALKVVLFAGIAIVALLLAFAFGVSRTVPNLSAASSTRLDGAVVHYLVVSGDTSISIAQKLAPQPSLAPIIQAEIAQVEGGSPLAPGTVLNVTI